jgi:hypothetical protein
MGTIQDENMLAFWVAQRSVATMQSRLNVESDAARHRALVVLLEEEQRKLAALS